MAKRLRWLPAAMVLLAGACTAVGGCGQASAPEVLLSRAYAVGDRWVQEVTINIDMDTDYPDSIDMTGYRTSSTWSSRIREEWRVTDVSEGVITLVERAVLLEMIQNGQRQSLPESEPTEYIVKIDSTGRTLSVEAPAIDDTYEEAAQRIFGDESESGVSWSNAATESSFLYPPDGTASVGEEWIYEDEMPFNFPGIEGESPIVTAKARLAAVSSEDGKQMATIDVTANAPMDLVLDLSHLYQQLAREPGSASDQDLVVKGAMRGQWDVSGTAVVDTETGLEESLHMTIRCVYDFSYVEAPEDFLPPELMDESIGTSLNVEIAVAQVE